MPEGANPVKVRDQGMGAEVIFYGANFDEARQHCEALAADHGYRYIHSGDEPHLIAGVATGPLEMLEDMPDLAGSWCRWAGQRRRRGLYRRPRRNRPW